ncbi:hypothetical protein VTK26DRAFT_9114 [Humicola hyalothermophila]
MAHRPSSILLLFAAFALLLLLLPSPATAATAGCGRAPTITSGTRTSTINGRSRRWIVRVPQNYDADRPYRLILGLHWLDGDFQAVDGGTAPYYGLQRLANESAIFVAPDGLNRGWANTGGEDVAFVDEILRDVSDGLCVDERQVFALGFSYGGAMSYALACARPDVFRGIAVLSGALLSGCNGGNQPVAFYGQHGVRDGVLNIGMGRQLRDRFVGLNGCTPQNAPEPGPGSRSHIKTVYTGCSPGYPVTWVAFDEDHVALPQDSGGDGGPNSWTPGEVWSFFEEVAATS